MILHSGTRSRQLLTTLYRTVSVSQSSNLAISATTHSYGKKNTRRTHNYESSPNSIYNINRKVKKQDPRKTAQQLQQQWDQAKNTLDDESYHDRDFDYWDQRQQFITDQAVERFGHDPSTTARAVVAGLGGGRRNALYEDDEDDLKLSAVKRSTTGSNKQMVNVLHQKFAKEVQQKERQQQQQKIKQQQQSKYSSSGEEFELSELSLDDDQADEMPKVPLSAKEERLAKKKARPKVPLPYDIDEINQMNILDDIVSPLHRVSYHNQLRRKNEINQQVLIQLGTKLHRMNGPVQVSNKMMPCPLEPVRASPVTTHYRNKDEFTIMPGLDGKITAGFQVGQQSTHDRVVCVPPDQIIVSKDSHIELAKKFQLYLREVSPYDYCHNYGDAGHWRRLHIRSNQAGDHMLIANMHPQELTEAQLTEEMDRLKQYFALDPLVRSLYLHTSRNTRSTHAREPAPYYHLAGDETITEHLFDKQFVISPSSFFQINTQAAEVLYRVIMTEASPPTKRKDTVLLDLCCGTGVLSVLMASQVKHVVAIDQSASAIEDARRNAKLNQVANISFHTGMVEDILPQVADQGLLSAKHIVAVANPSRRALHPKIIRSLRSMNCIEKLVYVSCKPDGDAFSNFVELCNSRAAAYNPSATHFVPTNAVPVDLFPQTPQCELVLNFERFTPE